jgi:hypothetical protein
MVEHVMATHREALNETVIKLLRAKGLGYAEQVHNCKVAIEDLATQLEVLTEIRDTMLVMVIRSGAVTLH